MAQVQNFYLEELNIQVEAIKALLHGGENTQPFLADADATLKIPVSHARKLFQYQADAIDVDDLNKDDIQFRMFHRLDNNVDSETGLPRSDINSGVENLLQFNSKNIIPAEAHVDLNMIEFYGRARQDENEKKVNADFVRHVAKEVFGVPVTDLFSNERTVRHDILRKSAENYVSNIESLVNFRVDYTDASNQYVRSKNNDLLITEDATVVEKATNFPSRLIFSQLLNSAPQRFASLDTLIDPSNVTLTQVPIDQSNNLLHLFDNSDNAIPVDGSGNPIDNENEDYKHLWRYMPLMVNDAIYFKLTIIPDPTQESVTRLNNEDDPAYSVPQRTYRIKMLLVSDQDESVYKDPTLFDDQTPDPDETSMTDFKRKWTQLGWRPDITDPLNDDYPFRMLYYLSDAQNTNETDASLNFLP